MHCNAILEAVLHKTAAMQPSASYLTKHSSKTNKTCRKLLEKYGWISDILLRTPTHKYASVGRPATTCIYQLCADTGCNPEDLRGAIDDPN